MDIDKQRALLGLQKQGFFVHYSRGMYVSAVRSGVVFEVTQEWIDNETKYMSKPIPKVGDIVYKDSTYTCISLDKEPIEYFDLYKRYGIELEIEKFIHPPKKKISESK